MINVDNVLETLEWVEAHPRAFDMRCWFNGVTPAARDLYLGDVPVSNMIEGTCGAQACLAGIAAVQRAPEGTRYSDEYLLFLDGTSERILEWAARDFGMSATVANLVFLYSQDHDTAIARMRYLAGHPGTEDGELLKSAVPDPYVELEISDTSDTSD
jgi:hypothetical protein